MDIRQLRYFLAIANAPSISAAAQAVGVAQPSLSLHIQRMEEELGVRLLDRSSRGAALTEEGLALSEHARKICDDLDRCIADMREIGNSVRGQVNFGMPPSVSMVMSVPLAETVRVDLPEVKLRAIEAMSGYLKNWMMDATVDMAFLYDLEDATRLSAEHVLSEEIWFYSAPDAWPLDTPPGTPVPLRQLEGLDMILPSNGLRRLIDRATAENDVQLRVVIEMDALTQIKELVARGSGYTMFAPAAAQDFVARGELLRAPIVEPEITRPVYLVYDPARITTRACRSVRDVTLDVARELVRRGIWEGTLT
ncbi:LysR substrate-binding domain-containing protein [Paracoccus aerodenitrificans]|uniref:LysR substrate-binding domain-containing protein n=1 Tax=Paracoccus aerodenitrificans TaxID=3017781 RepID=UPI0022F0371F|nr:LysR substrate-binding domain-containing protein [Paracoccus aerodenitrificans]WBU62767.1 LysR substrate-binding domain-containing protein [Paracoccus aerodenitrificans]